MDLLRDPIWQFVGAILPVIIVFAQRKLKGLSYHVIEDTTVVKVDEHIAPRVQTLFDGQPVRELRHVEVKLINVGHIDIKSKDYETPIEINLGNGAQILEATISGVQPASLKPVVEMATSSVLLKPIMLHSGEHIIVRVLAGNSHQPVQVLGRIAGVRDITNYLRSSSYGWYWRQVQSQESRSLLLAWSVFPALFGLMGIFGMIQVTDGHWLWLWIAFLAVWYSLLALLVALLLAAVPLVIRPLKYKFM